MRTPLPLPRLLAALGLSLALAATGCGSTPSADPALEPCDLAPGETLFAGDLVLVVTHIQPN